MKSYIGRDTSGTTIGRLHRVSTDYRPLYRPTVDRVSTDYRPSVDRVSTDCRSSVDRLSTECRPLYRPLYRPISRSTLPTVNKIRIFCLNVGLNDRPVSNVLRSHSFRKFYIDLWIQCVPYNITFKRLARLNYNRKRPKWQRTKPRGQTKEQ